MQKILPDQRFIEGLAKSDYAVVAEIDKKCRPMLTKWVTGNSGSVEDAEDLFADTLLTLYDRVHQDKPLILTHPFSAYFMGIARNKWFEELRKRKKESKVRNVQVKQYIEESSESIEEELVQMEAASERFHSMEKTFKQLSDRCRQLLDMIFNRGFTPEEIVEKLGFNSRNAYYVRKKKCLDRWRMLLAEQ